MRGIGLGSKDGTGAEFFREKGQGLPFLPDNYCKNNFKHKVAPMKLHSIILTLIAGCVMGWMTTSCTRYITAASPPGLHDGKYDSSFPFGNDTDALEKIVASVRLLNAVAHYKQYDFSRAQEISPSQFTGDFLKKHADQQYVSQDFAVGTATVIYADRNRIAVLTCAHVVNFPDTVITYYILPDGSADSLIRSVAIKTKERIHLSDLRQGENLKILAMDTDLDVAVLGKEFVYHPPKTMPVLPVPPGKARELHWGNFVYVIGFPAGKKMITRGIISNPNRGTRHGFLVDALFNRGFSGGIVLALRDGVPNFELVGIVNSVSAETEVKLAPESGIDQSLVDSNIPYTGNIYLRTQKNINYGISFGISIEAIRDFIREHSIELENAGYHLAKFLK